MEKKRINKLMIPFTRRTLSLLSAVTIMTTSMVGCSDKDKSKDNSSDISTITSSSSSMEEMSSELDVIESVDSSTKETSSVISENNTNNSSKESQTSAKPSSGSTTSNNQSSNKKPSSSSSSSKKPSQSSSTDQKMPSKLTASNINDVEVFEHFADKFRDDSGFELIRYNGEMTDGVKEFQLAMALLNKDYVNQQTMAELFGDFTLSEFQDLGDFQYFIISSILKGNSKYKFDKYCIDKDLGNYLLEAQNIFISKNKTKMEKLFEGYYLNDSNVVKQGDNFLVDYLMHCAFNMEMDLNIIENQDVGLAYFDYIDNINKFPNRLAEIYNKFKNKVKTIS